MNFVHSDSITGSQTSINVQPINYGGWTVMCGPETKRKLSELKETLQGIVNSPYISHEKVKKALEKAEELESFI